jgi:hypothetical protein
MIRFRRVTAASYQQQPVLAAGNDSEVRMVYSGPHIQGGKAVFSGSFAGIKQIRLNDCLIVKGKGYERVHK